MVNNKANVVMITEEDIEGLLVEWDNVPTWIKIHVSVKHPAHRCEGQLLLEDENLVFRGRDMKEGRNFGLEIPLDAITDITLGFDKELATRIAFDFGTRGFEPFAVRYQDNGESRTIYFNDVADNYPPHINLNNRKWYKILEELITGNSRLQLGRTNHRVLVGV